MLPAAPAGAIQFLMGGPSELIVARAVPNADNLSVLCRDAARAARRAVTTYDEIHAHGRALSIRGRKSTRRTNAPASVRWPAGSSSANRSCCCTTRN